jgi:hypothetical protein
MSEEITQAAVVEFNNARKLLSENNFHAVQMLLNNDRYWSVIWKLNGKLTNIKIGLTKAKAIKLAEALNKKLKQ